MTAAAEITVRRETGADRAATLDVVRRAFGAADQDETEKVVLLEGDAGFYSRHGHVAAGSVGLVRPSDRIPAAACQVLLLPAHRSSLAGRLVYPDVFWRFDAVGLRGETLATVEAALDDQGSSPATREERTDGQRDAGLRHR